MEERERIIKKITAGTQPISPIPEFMEMPEQWPPLGWPACPTPERFNEAMNYIAGNFGKFQEAIIHSIEVFRQEQISVTTTTFGSMPPRIRKDVEIMMSEMVTRAICMMLPNGPEDPEMSNIHLTDRFLAASRMTNQQSIGTVIIAERGKETPQASYGVMHRDPDWMGLCPGLTEVRNLEALVFCDKKQSPDVIMAIPQKLLREDPRKVSRCIEGRELENEETSQTLVEVLRHHGATPHFIDLYDGPEKRKRKTTLANLLGLP